MATQAICEFVKIQSVPKQCQVSMRIHNEKLPAGSGYDRCQTAEHVRPAIVGIGEPCDTQQEGQCFEYSALDDRI